ncbi:phosphoribosyl-ATP diphosphatase [Acuticoccus sp. MNP-M23]|uniref:phosphoribosyl-ATP diphosphatase n=1 Tax=Acuticoccus sp. MNP-M23 TaxID=3072793 RepID=UPI002816865D|nr:phosphoribosyl-ATP diphosphatase [Acuticoccus sp. MNP-M23]WMS44184.1 phosphoribosyl-ATP diphosphatase [Acuticoccus sp. MNP-M23]
MTEFSVRDLEAIVRARLADEGAQSYTRTLAAKGIDKCAEKFGEESVETVIAAVQRDPAALAGEAADVIYHLTVLLAVTGSSWDAVMAELQRRTGQSGLEEKASRLSG